ncbi:MAG TPA: SH3 domain-containing protein [Methylophilaceae bacterium]|nr:SH3 domain-containing protein [Methylophilaceae bacterium]
MHSKNSKPRRLLEKPRIKTLLLAAALLALLPNLAAAVEFRSIAPPKAVLYDAPSQQGKKLFIISQGSPVEVIVNLREWVKIRDHLGGLSWIPADQLSPKHTVMVTQARAEIRQTADANAAVGAYVEKNVVLEMLEPPKNGWIKVRHRDGLVGYILASSVWGY